MIDLSHFPLFVAASLALLITPGPNVMFVIARSMNQGRKAGVVSVLGLEMGTLLQVTAAATSISAIVLSSASAFNVIKYLGAGYLVYLGICKSLERDTLGGTTVNHSANLRRVFGQGVLVGLLNPKTGLFFFGVLAAICGFGARQRRVANVPAGVNLYRLSDDYRWRLCAAGQFIWSMAAPQHTLCQGPTLFCCNHVYCLGRERGAHWPKMNAIRSQRDLATMAMRAAPLLRLSRPMSYRDCVERAHALVASLPAAPAARSLPSALPAAPVSFGY